MGKKEQGLVTALGFGAFSGAQAGAAGGPTGSATGALIATSAILINYLLSEDDPKAKDSEPPTFTVHSATSPARWILGRARVGGNLVWLAEKGKDLYLIYVLAEGENEQIEEVYVNGERYEFADREELDDGGHKLTPDFGASDKRFWIYEYFAADGEQGESAREFAAEAGGLEWDASHKLEGLSYCLVHLQQNKYSETSSRAWRGVPQISFLVKGLKFENPALSTPTWSANAADAIYWWLTARRGIPADEIDEAAFLAARTICGTPPPARTEGRYSVDGVISSADDPAEIDRQLYLAIAGFVVEYDGIQFLRPGADRPLLTTITPADIIEEPQVSPAPPQYDRVNAVRASLAADRFSDWTEQALPRLESALAISRDKTLLLKDAGQLRFVSRVSHGYHLLRVALRQATASLAIDVVCRPGLDLDLSELIPGDKVAIDLIEYGLDDFEMMVQRIEVRQDWSVGLRLQEWPEDLFSDAYDIPDLSARRFPVSQAVDPVSGLAAEAIFQTDDDGTLIISADVGWEAGARNHVALRLSGPDGRTLRAVSGDEDVIVRGLTVGAWLISARAISSDGRSSAEAFARLEIPVSSIPAPPAPVILDSVQVGTHFRVVFAAENNRSIAGVEVRFTSASVDDDSALAEVNEANWRDAKQLSLVAVVPSIDGGPLTARLLIEETARYRLFARYANRSGRLSPITEIDILVLARPLDQVWSRAEWPAWGGERVGLERWDHSPSSEPQFPLLPAGEAAENTSASLFNGGGDWPFGAGAAAPSYTSEVVDLEQARQVDVRIQPQFHHPESAGATTWELEYRFLDTDAWLSIPEATLSNKIRVTARYIRYRLLLPSINAPGLQRGSISAAVV